MIDRINRKYFLLAVGNSYIGNDTEIDIAVRCPVCGDSRTKQKSARLHLYHRNGSDFVGCFNGDCPCVNKNVYSFIRDFYPSLLNNYKRENLSNTINKLSLGGEDDVFKGIDQSPRNPKEINTLQVVEDYLTPFNNKCVDYLKKRGIIYTCEKYGKWFYAHQDLKINGTNYRITGSIVIPLYYRDEMYGFYSRSLNAKSFYTWMNENNVGFKVWNWFNIDKTEPVYIFEGIFDAISSGLGNVIALLGAKIPSERLNELKKPVFVLDNDKTGLLNSLEHARNRHCVYIQPNKYMEKDMNALLLNQPTVDLSKLIKTNIYAGISAEVRIKTKL